MALTNSQLANQQTVCRCPAQRSLQTLASHAFVFSLQTRHCDARSRSLQSAFEFHFKFYGEKRCESDF